MSELEQPLDTTAALTQILGDRADVFVFALLRFNEFGHKRLRPLLGRMDLDEFFHGTQNKPGCHFLLFHAHVLYSVNEQSVIGRLEGSLRGFKLCTRWLQFDIGIKPVQFE